MTKKQLKIVSFIVVTLVTGAAALGYGDAAESLRDAVCGDTLAE